MFDSWFTWFVIQITLCLPGNKVTIFHSSSKYSLIAWLVLDGVSESTGKLPSWIFLASILALVQHLKMFLTGHFRWGKMLEYVRKWQTILDCHIREYGVAGRCCWQCLWFRIIIFHWMIVKNCLHIIPIVLSLVSKIMFIALSKHHFLPF